jgi:hypothetical protein
MARDDSRKPISDLFEKGIHMRHFRRIMSVLAVALGAISLSIAPAQAATDFGNAPSGAHYANGYGEPSCQLNGLTVTCSGTQIAGVGNTNATVSLAVTSTFTGKCHNPGTNSKIVEPFTKAETTSTTATLVPTKNGRLVVPGQTATGTSSQEFLDSFSCPNPNWTPELTGTAISWTYTLTFAGFSEPAIWISG